ncbi:MAG: NrfD/PsrC family molybdoenzyme membrane anchor subunit [Deltaproteobacteria bacterium]
MSTTSTNDLARGLDPERTDDTAEAATQTKQRTPDPKDPPRPAPAAAAEAGPGYYDLPVIKAAPWKGYIAAYFYAGGVAGAAAALHGALLLRAPDRRLAPLATKLRWIAIAGEVIGSGLLIADLGRPARFHHMMRVVRPTSPMNVGTWILSAAGATSALALVKHELLGQPDRTSVTSAINMLAGAALTTYTGVLVGNTAVPVWKATRVVLPVLFAASAGASAASLLELAGASTRRERGVVRRFALATKVTALAASFVVDRAAGSGNVGAALREGRAGQLWRGARLLKAASLVASAIPSRGKLLPQLAGALGTAAGLAMRFAILAAGRASAAEPRATLEPT